jgi:hypothetical protein
VAYLPAAASRFRRHSRSFRRVACGCKLAIAMGSVRAFVRFRSVSLYQIKCGVNSDFRLLLANRASSRPRRLVFVLMSLIVVFDQTMRLWVAFDRNEEFSTVAAENHPCNDDRARTFQEKTVPADTRLAGWAALVQTFGVQAPVRRPSGVSEKHVKASRREERGWNVFDKRYWPGESFGDQLGFALRHEDLDLLVLKRLFEAVPPETVTAFVRSAPTGAPTGLVPL